MTVDNRPRFEPVRISKEALEFLADAIPDGNAASIVYGPRKPKTTSVAKEEIEKLDPKTENILETL